MAIGTNSWRAEQQDMLEVLKHRMQPEQFSKLLKGEYNLTSDKDPLTCDITIVVMDQNTLIHKEVISEDFFAQEKVPSYGRKPWPKGTDPVDPEDMTAAEYRKQYEGRFDHTANAGRYSQGPTGKDPKSRVTATEYHNEREKEMSNKFLPFIVETSTPLHILKTLLSRSKGMNEVLVASILHLVLAEDIKKLRTIVKELPEMPLEKVYEELLTKFPKYRIHDEVLKTFQAIPLQFPTGEEMWSDELSKYDVKDVMLFFCAMAYATLDTSEYSPYSFNRIMGPESDEVMENIPKYVNFEDNGNPVTFKNEAELRSFIMYHAFFRATAEPETLPDTYCAAFYRNVEND